MAGIIAETEAHLHDQVGDRVALGAAESDAIREAIRGFGSAEAFARHAANGMTDRRTAFGSRIGLRILAAGIFALAVSFTCYSGSSPWLLSNLSNLSHDSSFPLRFLG